MKVDDEGNKYVPYLDGYKLVEYAKPKKFKLEFADGTEKIVERKRVPTLQKEKGVIKIELLE